MIKEFSLKNDAELKLTDNFKVKEFACKDGSDKVLIDTDGVHFLQKMRSCTGYPITIVSGYRTPTYNEQVGGAKNSQHCKGTAFDIKGKSNMELLKALLELSIEYRGIYSIGIYPDYIHLDTRTLHKENRAIWLSDKLSASDIKNYMLQFMQYVL